MVYIYILYEIYNNQYKSINQNTTCNLIILSIIKVWNREINFYIYIFPYIFWWVTFIKQSYLILSYLFWAKTFWKCRGHLHWWSLCSSSHTIHSIIHSLIRIDDVDYLKIILDILHCIAYNSLQGHYIQEMADYMYNYWPLIVDKSYFLIVELQIRIVNMFHSLP